MKRFTLNGVVLRSVALAALLAACGKDDETHGSSPFPKDAGSNGEGGTAGDDSGAVGDDSGMPPKTGCIGLQCAQEACTGGTKTSISGKVYDPAGKNPLYNIVVYVPNAELEPLPEGATCAACDTLFSGSPVVVTQTDATGSFTLANAPSGANIPLVMQVGKWRRRITIPNVAPCQDNAQPDKSLRLPKNRSEGDLPNIAVSTGGADTLECLLRRIGVDASEYTHEPAGAGRVHIFQGGGNNAPNTAPAAQRSHTRLWNSKESLMAYDILLLSCEGRETGTMNQQALHDYASAGGRVFASHFHYSWFNTGPYGTENLATWRTGSNDIGNIQGELVTTLPNGQEFPKGVALQQWLGTVNALQNGRLPIEEARNNATVSASNTPSQPWILVGQGTAAAGAAQYFSFNTPTNTVTGPDQAVGYCGRVVYSDLHVGAASGDSSRTAVPASCANADLSAQEKALEFMLFDLSSCVVPDDKPPLPPVILM